MKNWENLLNELGVNEKIISNPKAKEKIVHHIISAILRNTDKVHEYTGYLPTEPISEMSEEQLAELLTIINQHPSLGTNLSNLKDGFSAGMTVDENGSVLLQYSLIGHDRFGDHMNTTLIKSVDEEIFIDTQILDHNSSKSTREIYDNDGILIRRIIDEPREHVLERTPDFEPDL